MEYGKVFADGDGSLKIVTISRADKTLFKIKLETDIDII